MIKRKLYCFVFSTLLHNSVVNTEPWSKDVSCLQQVVCSICELVEACTSNIRSGWKPLFGALRVVRVETTANEELNELRQQHVAAVLDVFNVFLATDNVVAFANAAVDCILCLLKYVRGPGAFFGCLLPELYVCRHFTGVNRLVILLLVLVA